MTARRCPWCPFVVPYGPADGARVEVAVHVAVKHRRADPPPDRLAPYAADVLLAEVELSAGRLDDAAARCDRVIRLAAELLD